MQSDHNNNTIGINLDESNVLISKKTQEEGPTGETLLFDSMRQSMMTSKREFGQRVQDFTENIKKIDEAVDEEGVNSVSKKEFSDSFINLNEEMLGADKPNRFNYNVNYPPAPEGGQEESEVGFDQNGNSEVDEFFVLGSNKVLSNVFGEHSVNVRILEKGNFKNLFQNSLFEIFMKLEGGTTVRFVMALSQFKKYYQKLGRTNIIHPSYPLDIADKFLKDSEYLEFCFTVFFQKVLYSRDQLLIRETCLFISHLLRNQEKIREFQYVPEYLEQKGFLQSNFDYLYSSIYLFFKKNIKKIHDYKSQSGTQDFENNVNYFSDYEKFKLGLEASYNVKELMEEFKKMKSILENILKKERKLKKEVNDFKMMAEDEQLKGILGEDLEGEGPEVLKENIENLVNFTQFFNEKAFSQVLYILQSFINDIKNLMGKLNTEKNFEKCKGSLVGFVLGYVPLSQRLKGYCQCLINGAK